MDIKLLESDFEKYLFLREYNQRAKMNVPSAYIFECTVYAVFIDGKMLGGFAFAEGEDMAWPAVIPEADQLFSVVPKAFCLEINLVWASGELHSSPSKMLKFWLSICKFASKLPEVEYISYAVDSSRTSLVAMYDALSLGQLYSGSIPKYPGRSAKVFYTTPIRCKLALFLCFKHLVKKIIKKTHQERFRANRIRTQIVKNLA